MVRFPVYSNMRILILIDGKNFEQGIINLSKKRNEFRFVDFHKIKNFILEFLQNNPQYEKVNLSIVRVYFYSGEYTNSLIENIERHFEKNKENNKLKELLGYCKKKYETQNNFYPNGDSKLIMGKELK